MITFLDGTDGDEVLKKWVAYTMGFHRVSRRNRVVVCYVTREEAVVGLNEKQHALADGRILRLSQIRPCEAADPITFVSVEQREVRVPVEWVPALPQLPVQAADSRPWTAEDAAERLWAEFARIGAPERLRVRLRNVLVEAFQAGFELAAELDSENDVRDESAAEPRAVS